VTTTSPTTSATTAASAPQSINLSSVGGLDTQTLVQNLVQVASLPMENLQTQETSLQSVQAIFDNLSSLATTLASTAQGLSLSTDVESYAASSTDSTKVTATATTGAQLASHSLTVSSLAQATVLASEGYASATATGLGTGTVAVTVGSNTTSVAIGAGQDSLQGIASAINARNLGVQASIVNDGSSTPERLVLTGKSTGLANAVSLDASGLSGGTATPLSWTTIAPAKDASFSVDGIAMTRSSNTVPDALSGVTLDLVAPTASGTPVTIGVTADSSTMTSSIQNLVSAYNAIVQSVSTNSAAPVGAASGGTVAQAGGPLLGDPFADLGINMLQDAINSASGPSGAPNLAVLGITTQSDGTLAVDSTTLASAIAANPSAVSQLIANAATGLTVVANNLSISGSGVFSGRSAEIQTEITDVSNQITAQQTYLTTYQANLTLEYSQLNSLMASFNQQANYLTQEFPTTTTSKTG
jgi:flagellar hook-associated protein 2